jgi:hypothetical protein
VYILLNFDPTKNKIILENYSECAITSPPPTDPPKTDPPQQTKPAPVMTAAKKVDRRVEHTLEQIEAGIERLEQRLPEMHQSVIKTVRTTGHTVRGKVRAQLFPDDSSGAQ